MNAAELHRDAIVIDGLIISNWSREVFEDMLQGGITAANCTCSIWEGFRDTMANIARWKAWFDEHDYFEFFPLKGVYGLKDRPQIH